MKILIVENTPAIVELLLQTIHSLNPNVYVTVSDNGEDGLIDAWFHQPDLIITCLTMPKLDGFEMVRLLRLEQTGQRMPILGMSSNSGKRVADFRQLCDDCLTKPINLVELRSKLARWIPAQKDERSPGLGFNQQNLLWKNY